LKIAIVGAGLIGTSVALAAERAWSDLTLTALDRGDTLGAAVGADVIVLATPVNIILDIIRHEASHFGNSLILDTGSTKRTIIRAARDAALANFVGGHPMAGAASTGPAAARADLFDGRPWFLVHADAGSAAAKQAQAFVHALGATPVMFSDDGAEHDSVMAAVSHLPQIVSTALMKVVGDAAGEAGLRWSGTGLRDTTRLAASSASVWEGVLVQNKTELRPLILKLADTLREAADRLEDPVAIQELFAAANRYRQMVD
jgi:prephenate dehydrogenase